MYKWRETANTMTPIYPHTLRFTIYKHTWLTHTAPFLHEGARAQTYTHNKNHNTAAFCNGVINGNNSFSLSLSLSTSFARCICLLVRFGSHEIYTEHKPEYILNYYSSVGMRNNGNKKYVYISWRCAGSEDYWERRTNRKSNING